MLAVEDPIAREDRSRQTIERGGGAPVFVVCSSRPRVGRTLVARLLVDFFRVDERPVVAYDANPNDPVLSDYLAAYTEPATVADTQGQMALFDRLIVPGDAAKIVDVAADQFGTFFDAMQAIDFAGEAGRAEIDVVVLYMAENHIRSAEAYRDLLGRFSGVTLVPVHNEIVETYGAPWLPHPAVSAAPIHIPHLPPYLHGVVRRRGFSFADYLRRAEQHPTLLHKWTSRPFIAFRDLELRLSLAEFAPLFSARA